MKKITLSIFTLLGINAALAQSNTGDNTPTNATQTGHKLEKVTDTVYIPAKDADGSMKHDFIIHRKEKPQKNRSNTTNTVTTKPEIKPGPRLIRDTASTK